MLRKVLYVKSFKNVFQEKFLLHWGYAMHNHAKLYFGVLLTLCVVVRVFSSSMFGNSILGFKMGTHSQNI